MQKIIIKNFGAIKEAEIDIPKTLVLIGEQASGKSTIAKLIYFFQTLKEDYLRWLIVEQAKKDFALIVKNKFLDLFDSDIETGLELRFYPDYKNNQPLEYSNQIYIFIAPKSDIQIKFPDNYFNEKLLNLFENNFSTLKKINELESQATKSEEFVLLEKYRKDSTRAMENLSDINFNLKYDNAAYLIAGRSATVSFGDLYEKYIFRELKDRKNIDDLLISQFIEHISRIKTLFKNRGGRFENVLRSEDKTPISLKAENKITEILKGKYINNGGGERLEFKIGKSISLNQSSSGQQEAIRILQDIFLVIAQNTAALRVIEEPEAHLFPIAQKQMIELLALMVNQNENSRLIITTHSPYILSTFNNLLFASRVIEKNPSAESDVSEIVDIDFRLKAADFAAYTLKNTEGGFVSESIMSDRGVIKQNYLDTASEMLSYEFNNLQLIHAKTFARK